MNKTKLHRNMALLFAALILMGCSKKKDEFQKVKDDIAYDLTDPSSAQFRHIRHVSFVVCGEVNAKNKFGGYTGFRKFGWIEGVVSEVDNGLGLKNTMFNEC